MALTVRSRTCHLQLFAWIEGARVDLSVEVGADVVEGPVVSERPPLHVDAHATLVSIHHLQVTHLLHVASVGARTYNTHKE